MVPGRPFLYYAHKVMEIASHLFGDIFATNAGDDGTGTDFHRNLFTYQPNVQSWLAANGALPQQPLQRLERQVHEPGRIGLFRRPDDQRHGRARRHRRHLQPSNQHVPAPVDGHPVPAAEYRCRGGHGLWRGPDADLRRDQLPDAAPARGFSIATYFVSRYDKNDSHVGCNDLLGYTTVTFEGNGGPLFVAARCSHTSADTNRMMSRIVQNIRASRDRARGRDVHPRAGPPERAAAPGAMIPTVRTHDAAHRPDDESGCERASGLEPDGVVPHPRHVVHHGELRLRRSRRRRSCRIPAPNPSLGTLTVKAGEPGPGPRSWREDLARSVREQEIQRQILYNSTRKAGTRLFLASRVRAGMPDMLPEFAKTLCGAVIGFWIVTALLTHFFHAKPLYALSTLGLLYSLQSAFHSYKLAADPS